DVINAPPEAPVCPPADPPEPPAQTPEQAPLERDRERSKPPVAERTIDIIGDSVYLFHANLFDLTRQTARVLGCDQPDARRVRPYAASLCCGLCCPLSARQDLGRQGASTPERRRRQRHFVTDTRQTDIHHGIPDGQS